MGKQNRIEMILWIIGFLGKRFKVCIDQNIKEFYKEKILYFKKEYLDEVKKIDNKFNTTNQKIYDRIPNFKVEEV